jgi:hypothetical protein
MNIQMNEFYGIGIHDTILSNVCYLNIAFFLMKMTLDVPTIALVQSNMFVDLCKNIVGVECHYATPRNNSFFD